MRPLAVLLLSFVAHAVLLPVEAGYRFEILLVGYQNPLHKCSDGSSCERSNRNKHCDNAFIICISRVRNQSEECDIGRFETTKIESANDNLVFIEGQVVGGVLNPMTVSGDTWPGQIEIMLTVYDIDGTDNRIRSSSDKVTDFRIFPDVAASTDGTFSAESNEESGYSSLQLKFRLACLPPHFGNNCSQLSSSTSTRYYSTQPPILPSDSTSSSYAAKSSVAAQDRVTYSPPPLLPTPPGQTVVSSTLAPVTVITVVRPSEDRALPLSVTLAVVSVGAVVIFGIVTMIVLLLIFNRKRKKKHINSASFDDSAFKLPRYLDASQAKHEDHLYESVKTAPRHSVSTISPTYAAVNAMHNIEEENPDNMALEKNVAYATVNVERNVAYGVVGRGSRYRQILPGLH